MKKLVFSMLALGVLFGNDLATIQKDKKIRIGVRLNQPPFSYQKDGEFSGFEVELAKKIAEKIVGMDGKVELIGINAKDRILYLKNNIADLMIATSSITPERAEQVDFSVPYLSNIQAIIAKKTSGITKIEDLKDKKLLIIPGTTSDAFMQKNPSIGAMVVTCENVPDCKEKLQNDIGDAYLHINILNAHLPIEDSNLTMAVPNVGSFDHIACMIAKDNKALLDSVNKAIYELSKEGFFQKAYEDELKPYFQDTLDKKFLLVDDFYNILNF